MAESQGNQTKVHPVVEEYSQLAERYDRKWSNYIAITTRETLARLKTMPSSRILDVGCGSGALLQQLAIAYPDALLSGIDLVPEMLAIAHRKLPPQTDLHRGSAENLPFKVSQFDVVISCNMFHYLRQPIQALREMRRVLRPGGQLVLTDWCDDYLACRICDRYLRFFNRAHFKTYRSKEFVHLLESNDFTQIQLDRYKVSWFWGMMTATAHKHA